MGTPCSPCASFRTCPHEDPRSHQSTNVRTNPRIPTPPHVQPRMWVARRDRTGAQRSVSDLRNFAAQEYTGVAACLARIEAQHRNRKRANDTVRTRWVGNVAIPRCHQNSAKNCYCHPRKKKSTPLIHHFGTPAPKSDSGARLRQAANAVGESRTVG